MRVVCGSRVFSLVVLCLFLAFPALADVEIIGNGKTPPAAEVHGPSPLPPVGSPLSFQKGQLFIRPDSHGFFKAWMHFEDGTEIELRNILGLPRTEENMPYGPAHAPDTRLIPFDPLKIWPAAVRAAQPERDLHAEPLTPTEKVDIRFLAWNARAPEDHKQDTALLLQGLESLRNAQDPDQRKQFAAYYTAEAFFELTTDHDVRSGRVPVPHVTLAKYLDLITGQTLVAVAVNAAKTQSFAFSTGVGSNSSGVWILPLQHAQSDSDQNGDLHGSACAFPTKLSQPHLHKIEGAYFNELALAYVTEDHSHQRIVLLAAHDDQAGIIHSTAFHVQDRPLASNKPLPYISPVKMALHAMETSVRRLVLPPAFEAGQHFAYTGKLLSSNTSPYFTVEPLSSDPASPRWFAPIRSSYEPTETKKTEASVDPMRVKNAQRGVYAHGNDAFRSWIRSLQAKAEMPALAQMLESAFATGQGLAAAAKPVDRHSQTTVFSFPNEILALQPSLGEEFWTQFSKNFEQWTSTTQAPLETVFFRWPRVDSETFLTQMQTYIRASRQELKARWREQRGPMNATLFVGIDFTSFNGSKSGSDQLQSSVVRFLEVAHEIADQLDDNLGAEDDDNYPRVRFEFILLAPESWSSILEDTLPEKDVDTVTEYEADFPSTVFRPVANWLDRNHRAQWLAKLTSSETKKRITPDQILEINRLVHEKMDKPTEPMDDFTQFRKYIALAVRHRNIDFSNPEHDVAEVARVVWTASGMRSTDLFPLETRAVFRQLPEMLNAASPLHIKGALHDREDILGALSSSLGAYGGYARAVKTAPRVFAFIGPPGSGKTQLTTLIATLTPNTAFRAVNCSATEDPASRRKRKEEPNYYQMDLHGDDRAIFQRISDAVEELRFAPEPFKLLLIDELTARPRVVRELLSSFGDSDRRGNKAIDFSGIVVVLAMNTDATEESRRLETIDTRSEIYARDTSALFVKSLSSALGTSDVDSKVVEATASRIQAGGGIFYFKTRKKLDRESDTVARNALREYELREGFRLILPPETVAAINKKLDTTSDHRVSGAVLDRMIQTAIADYLEKHGRDSLRNQIFLLRPPTDRWGLKWELYNVLASEEGLHSLLTEAYRLFHEALSQAMHLRMGQIRLSLESGALGEAETKTLTASLAQHKAFLEGLSHATTTALFTKDAKGLPEIQMLDLKIPWSEKQRTAIASDLQQLWNQETRRVFLDYHSQANPLFVPLMPGAAIPAAREENDYEERLRSQNAALVSLVATFARSYQLILSGTRVLPLDLGVSGAADHTTDWARELHYGVRQGNYYTRKNIKEEELALLRSIRTEWNKFFSEADSIPSKQVLIEKTFVFQTAALERVDTFLQSSPSSNRTDLHAFVLGLSSAKDSDGKTEADRTLEVLETAVATQERVEQTSTFTGEQTVALAAARHLDQAVRMLVAEMLKQNSPEARFQRGETTSEPAAAVAPPMDCKKLLLNPEPSVQEAFQAMQRRLNPFQ